MAGAFNVELTFGPMLIGMVFNAMLYGAMVVQTLVYFQTHRGDVTWFKIFVLYMLLCETVNTACSIGMVYEPLVIHHLAPKSNKLISFVLSAASPLLTVMVSVPVQLFIAWRVKIMSKSNIVPVIINILAVTSLVGGIATAIMIPIFHFQHGKIAKFDGAVITWLASSAAADIIITASLVYNLRCRRTGFGTTDGLINRIIRLTVQSGLITSVSATLDLAFFLGYQSAPLRYIWELSLSKLYSNSLLSTLNARLWWTATSTVHENVLFGSDAESGERSRPRVEIITTINDDRTGHETFRTLVPLKALDSAGGERHDHSQ